MSERRRGQGIRLKPGHEPDERLTEAYRMVFPQGDVPNKAYVDEVLEDLAWFCHANESSFDENPQRMAMHEGRREVYLRIQEWIDFDTSQLYENEEDGQ